MDDVNEVDSIVINEAYAKAYEKKKKAEELSKLQDKYGCDVDLSDSSSSSEDEDDDAIGVTPHKTKDFLRTLSLVKTQDPRIYDKNVEFYHDENSQGNAEGGPAAVKPLYLRDYERDNLLKTGGALVDSDNEEEHQDLTYNEEQKKLKQNLLMAATESSDGDILTIRVKSDEEKKKEEDDYIKWLRGQEAELNPDEKNDMKPLREYWCDPELNDDESFLRNYILDQMWMDKTKEIVPTYDDIIEEISESEDESALDEQEDFERKFNFRFEEPEGSSLVTFPRTIPSSVRRIDDTRKIKRKSREERKKLEKEQKKEELRRLKNLKKQEIFDKLEKLKELTGNPNVGFTEDDLQGDFDPNAHDQAMNKVFDDDYYENCEEDEVKPHFNDSDEDENWDEWIPGEDPEYEDGGPHCEDPDFNMDADYNPEAYVPSKKKRKRKSLLSKALKKDKPVFDTQEKSFEEYFDEYYNLDYEDIIGDVPCRFHYRSVVPNDFGLSTEEILTCEDRELNAWVSLKKAVKYRSDQEEKRDVRKYRLKAQNHKKKLHVLTSLGETDQDTPPVVGNKKKKSNKKGKQKTNSLSDNRLAAYGLDKPHNKKSKV